jgi:inner membrane protein
MDNLTHSLTGLALARAGLNRFSPHATFLLVLAANAPDVDIVYASRGALAYLEAHRGYTHCIVALPVMAMLSVLVVAALSRRRLPWLKAWLICCVGVASHLLLDWTNSYGIRLLLPFSSRWCHLDLNSLYDGYIWAILLIAAIWPLLSRLVSGEIGARSPAGSGLAITALALVFFFDCGRSILHGRAIAQLNTRLYQGQLPRMVAALPEPFTPFRWTGVVETESSFHVLAVQLSEPLDTDEAATYYKPRVDAGLQNASQTEPFRFFRYFARFPVWSGEPINVQDQQLREIDLADLRFKNPERGSFHCVAIETEAGKVLQSWFTFR